MNILIFKVFIRKWKSHLNWGLERRKVSLLKLFYMHHSPLAKTQFACRPYLAQSECLLRPSMCTTHMYLLSPIDYKTYKKITNRIFKELVANVHLKSERI